MSEIVTLPKEVAEAIEVVWVDKRNPEAVKHLCLTNWKQLRESYGGDIWNTLKTFAKHHPIKYMTALVNGYTVDQTKEERLLALYEVLDEDDRDEALERDGIRMALEILEITIPGINDKEESE